MRAIAWSKLPLGLHTEVVAELTERDLQLPALREPADDPQRLLRHIGAEQGLWVEAPTGVAQQHPADRHDWQATMAPDGGIGAELHHALALAIPVGHGQALPNRGLVGQHLGQGRQALALGAGPSPGLGLAWWGRLIECRVKAQAGDAGHVLPDEAGEELESGETAVGHEDEGSPRHPAAGLQDHWRAQSVSVLCRRPCSRQ